MRLNTRKLCLHSFLLLLLMNVILYLTYHISYLAEGSVWLSFVHVYFSEIVDYLLPAISAMLMLVLYAYSGVRSALLSAALFCSTRVIYYLLFHYVDLVVFASTPISSTDALLISSIYSLVLFAAGLVQTLVLFGIGLFIYKIIHNRKARRGESLSQSLSQDIRRHTMFDFDFPFATVLLSISVLQFLFHIGFEIYDTAVFFAEYGASFTTGELIYIIWRYLFYIIMLVLCHFITCLLKNAVFEKGKYLINEDN